MLSDELPAVDVSTLERVVREKLADGPIAVTTDLRTWAARWRRRYPVVGESDERCVAGASTYEAALAMILSWEEAADAER